MAKLLHIFYHKEGTFSLLCQQVQYFTLSPNAEFYPLRITNASFTFTGTPFQVLFRVYQMPYE